MDSLDPKDVPVKPSGMSSEARKFWDRYIVKAKHLRRADTALAQACAESWGLYRQAFELANTRPIDKDARIAVTQYFTQWKTALERLALDPLGRIRAGKNTVRPDTKNPLGEFGIVG